VQPAPQTAIAAPSQADDIDPLAQLVCYLPDRLRRGYSVRSLSRLLLGTRPTSSDGAGWLMQKLPKCVRDGGC
jgi:hypothetical protein